MSFVHYREIGAMTRAQELAVILVLSIVGIANLYDLVIDLSYGTTTVHLVAEGLMIAMSLAVITWLILHLRSQQKELQQIRRDIAEEKNRRIQAGAEGQQVRSKLAEIISQQFHDWQLTGSEQEVALLLLKGLSFKEIAGVRDTQEKTVRQQASAIYRKAGVNGRHAFSAWFIEDFL
jgi:DNA-binding CsgD family transcriptional regulator